MNFNQLLAKNFLWSALPLLALVVLFWARGPKVGALLAGAALLYAFVIKLISLGR